MLTRKYPKIKLLLIIALNTIFLAQSAEAFARARPKSVHKISHPRQSRIHPVRQRRIIRHRPRNYISFSIGGVTFRYGTGLYCNSCIDRYVVLRPAVGAFVSRLPFGYATIFINGDKYYCYDGTYYKAYRTGYLVVADPRNSADDKVVLNIPNSKGGYTAVVLEKTQEGYIGPQGELYTDNPTIEQLTVLYGE